MAVRQLVDTTSPGGACVPLSVMAVTYQCKKYVITNFCRLSVSGPATATDVAFATRSMTNDRNRVNRENDMQELTKAHHNDHRRLTSVEFQTLAQVPAAVEWFANLDNPRTRRAYQNDLEDFCGFVGLVSADEFRVVTRSHVLA